MTNIQCDVCELYDDEDRFPDIYSNRGREILSENGINLSDPFQRGLVQSVYAGAICPSCGNYSSFDFNPDGGRNEYGKGICGILRSE